MGVYSPLTDIVILQIVYINETIYINETNPYTPRVSISHIQICYINFCKTTQPEKNVINTCNPPIHPKDLIWSL